MDQELKQRLVGAIVITSLAAIFVPMLFDDPVDDSGQLMSELTLPPAPSMALDAESAKLPKSVEDVMALPPPAAIKKLQQQPTKKMPRWFVQVGTFGDEKNALAIRDKIRKQGFPVQINQKSSEKGVLYRVQVGPEIDRKRAEQLKLKVSKLNKVKAILTAADE